MRAWAQFAWGPERCRVFYVRGIEFAPGRPSCDERRMANNANFAVRCTRASIIHVCVRAEMTTNAEGNFQHSRATENRACVLLTNT
jgi:hypothetical protein